MKVKQWFFFFTVFFISQLCLLAQQNKNIETKPIISQEEILKSHIQTHKPFNLNDPDRTIISTKVLENGYVLESRTGQFWDGSDWVNSSFDLFTYNTEGLKIEEINQLWDNGSWQNTRRFLTSYSGSLISVLEEQSWNGTSWVGSYKYVSAYNSSDDLVEYNVLQWNSTLWDSLYKTIYTFNSAGNIETITDQTWGGSAWNNNYKYTYLYNSDDNVSERLTQEWINNAWENSLNDVYTYNELKQVELIASFWWPDSVWKESVEIYYEYDSDGNINDRLTKFWVNDTLGLQNKYHTVFEYLPGTAIQTKAEYQEWQLQSGVWINQYRNLSTYNEENLLEKMLMEVWGGNNWVPGSQEDYSYDENGNLDVMISKYWDGSQWINTFKLSHVWSVLVSVEDSDVTNPNSYSLEQNYPNPFNPSTTIIFNLGFDAEVSLTIYDILGNEITRLVERSLKAGRHEARLNASGLTSGVYFYRLNAVNPENNSTFTSVKKMTLLK